MKLSEWTGDVCVSLLELSDRLNKSMFVVLTAE